MATKKGQKRSQASIDKQRATMAAKKEAALANEAVKKVVKRGKYPKSFDDEPKAVKRGKYSKGGDHVLALELMRLAIRVLEGR